jgi:hypothetical protein
MMWSILIVEQVVDLTADLRTVSGLDATFPLVPGRGDEAKHGGSGIQTAASLKPSPSRAICMCPTFSTP